MASNGGGGCGGYDKNFVETPPDELICLICQSVAIAPQQLTCCGKLYCKACLDKQKKVANSCPTCRKVINSFPDHLSSRRINSLIVKCDNEKKGCKWEGELINLKGHIINCKHNMAKCRHCSKVMTHKDVAKHHNECPNATIVCPNPGCNVKEQRSKMSAHRNTCQKEKVPCTYSEIGCGARVNRDSIQEHMAKSIQQHLTIAMDRITALQEIKRPPPLGVYKMSNFGKLKRDDEEWHSPPFYTHEGGYKMCLSVSANGFGGGKGTHVSVYVHIMASNNDKNLLWPFRGEITYELLNQLDDKNHKVQTMKFDTNEIEDHNYVVDSGMSVGWGIPRFISHSALGHNPANNCQYLKDDCLYFRVTQAKVYKSNKPWLTPFSHN